MVPEAVPELSTIPLPAVEETKFPAVAVMLPAVAVNVVVAVTDPGATKAEGMESTTAPVVGVAVI